MFWIAVNTFFAVLMLTVGIHSYILMYDKPIGEIGGPRVVFMIVMVLGGSFLTIMTIYATVVMAIRDTIPT